ncbi:MAG: HAD family hydrolase [Polyangiaceae bacterium]|nr:HAD family hydrolase [Polyangiaceae bacterium]
MVLRQAALFDMDRTLIRRDTASLYVRYQRDRGEVSRGYSLRVAWWLFKYTLGVIDAEKVAERALASYRGKEEAWMAERCQGWFRDYVLPHVTDSGRRAVERHRASGDVLVIVTGATRYAAEPLARELGIDHVVCTELEVDPAGRFTGKLTRPMCYGHGKITRTQRLAAEQGFDLGRSCFYSDSITDRPLLEHVHEPIVVNPDARLRRLAKQRGWRIERW